MKPVSVVVKIRQGRKACTLVTNFEPFFITADSLADDLRHLCASSTAGWSLSFIYPRTDFVLIYLHSVSPLPGKNAGLEVMVQGKQLKAVANLLMTKGVPKKWIEEADLSDKKK